MRQMRLLGVALMAMLALGALSAAFAAAEEAKPNMLVTGGTAGSTFKDKSGESKFEAEGLLGKSVVVCSSSTSNGVFTTEKKGTFSVKFEKCLVKVLTALLLCTGLSDVAGSSSITT